MLFDSSTMQSSMHNINRSEIRTRATEVTGALNQRLRPLGHPAYLYSPCKVGWMQMYYLHCKIYVQSFVQ